MIANPGLLLQMLLKAMGISEADFKAAANAAQETILHGKETLDRMEARLARIESALGTDPETKPPEPTNE